MWGIHMWQPTSHYDHGGPVLYWRKTHVGNIYERKEEFTLATVKKQFKDVYINPWVLLGLRELGVIRGI